MRAESLDLLPSASSITTGPFSLWQACTGENWPSPWARFTIKP
ncbi:MAG TPA: hypothetical protein PLZ57_10275 [Pseudobdellovibrionaceae bacterium]|nr:hypothetical protein [Pseudobdellovibrionaceae bacterium]